MLILDAIDWYLMSFITEEKKEASQTKEGKGAFCDLMVLINGVIIHDCWDVDLVSHHPFKLPPGGF